MNITDEVKIKHLEFIQSIITRMNTNSFQLKGMSITITAAILALYASSKKPLYFFIAIVPTILFWFLDAYYLQQERKFRGIYSDVAELSNEKHRIAVRDFEMPLQKYTGGKYCYWRVFWSRTIWPIYLIPLFALLLGGILLGKGFIRLIIV
jgi:hypothetical protein